MLKRAAIILLSVCATLLVLELGLRFYFANFGRDDQKRLYLYSQEELVRLASVQPLPYLNYGLRANVGDSNAQGYRGASIAMPKPEGVFRIVAVGGSTTYGLWIDDWRATYPAQLERVLRETYGYDNVEVVNAGVNGYGTHENVVNLALRLPDLEPDLLIFYEATNDIPPRLIHPDDYQGLNLQRGVWSQNASVPPSTLWRFIAYRFGLRYDSIDTQLVRAEGVRLCGSYQVREDDVYCALLNMPVRKVLASNPPVYYERNLRTLVTLARLHGAEMLLVTWIYSKLDYSAIDGGNYFQLDFHRQAIADHNAVLARVAQELGAPFYDFAAEMPDERAYWYESMHVNAAGARKQAELFAAFLHERALIRR